MMAAIAATCGSSDVLADAWASWNTEIQDWELHSTFDEAHCNSCDGSTKLDWKEPEESKTERTRRLNDEMRAAILTDGVEPYGTMVITTGIQALLRKRDETVLGELKERIATYDAFDAGNDPHQEHDFGAFLFCGAKLFWKLDYYAPGMVHGSEDPSDREKTVRALTVMLAEEY